MNRCYKFDIESWDQTNGTIYVWVLINPLPHAADVTLYACYGDSATPTYQGGTAGQAWNSDYTHVLHFGNGSSLLVSDSTSNGNDGTNHGATAASGLIGGAVSLNGLSGYVTIPSIAAHSAFTIEFWMNSPSLGNVVFANAHPEATAPGFNFTFDSNPYLCFRLGSSSAWAEATYMGILSNNTPYHVVGTYDGATARIYLNGNQGTPGTQAGLTNAGGYLPTFGYNPSYGGGLYAGLVDEARMLQTNLSSDWIVTEYRNQSAVRTYVTLGAESGGATPAVILTPIIM